MAVAGLCCTQLNPEDLAKHLHIHRVDRSTERPCHCFSDALSQQLLDHMPMHIGQAPVDAVVANRQLQVIDAQ
jgi:hypothetical protein